jgi:hypothetical protein
VTAHWAPEIGNVAHLLVHTLDAVNWKQGQEPGTPKNYVKHAWRKQWLSRDDPGLQHSPSTLVAATLGSRCIDEEYMGNLHLLLSSAVNLKLL